MNEIELPAPTAWPVVMAFGATLAAAGLLTDLWVTGLGGVLFVVAAVGWFRDVLPVNQYVRVPVTIEDPIIEPRPSSRYPHAREHRVQLPMRTYPVTAGIKGGVAGGIAMAALAIVYGIVSHHGVWYPINLLAACVVRDAAASATQLEAFHASSLLVAIALHGFGSLLVGVLYGTMLPMLPRSPVVLGGVVAPLCWTGLLHPALGIINPVLDARINWWWFSASQLAFGVVAGLVVRASERVSTERS